jgi:small conductance mechanosensitive channel
VIVDPLEPLRVMGRDLLNPQRLAGVLEAVLAIAMIAVGAWVALRVSLGVVRHTAAWRTGHPGARVTPIAEGLVRYAIIFAALILMFGAVHINITPVLASAGVLGLVLGFGAQYIIRDLLAGVFLLSEGIIQVGDIVRVDGDVGTVERVSIRITQIRKSSGELLTIPNGAIARIGNLSRSYAVAIVQITIPYTQDAGAALEALRNAGRAWAAEVTDKRAEPTVDGIVELRDFGAVLQLSVAVAPERQYAVAADLRRRAIEAMTRAGIKLGAGVPSGIPPGT